METLRQDVTYALRRLIKAPLFTVVAVLTLGLGIGANAAIFSVVHGVLLKPLPYPESDRLVGIYHVSEGTHRTVMSGPNFMDVMHAASTLENAAAISRERLVLTGAGDPLRLTAAGVSASLFNVLRVQPALGRGFNADEDTPGKDHVIVLSHALWQQRFGADPAVIGREIQVDGVSREIVGVMPADFSYPAGIEAWIPLTYDANFVSKQRGAWYLNTVARLKAGVTPQQSAAEVEAIGRNLARQYPGDDGSIGMTTYPLLDAMVGNIRTSILVLL
ncbi:MAG TPA: ABC transporter permease, partial [Vicinamibacterales bacterium]|nr:ABC transporter permease [Vicinamibacterales bacterium]